LVGTFIRALDGQGRINDMKYIRASFAISILVAGGLLVAPTAQAAHPMDSTPCSKRLISAHEGYTQDADGDTVESQLAAFDIGSNIADSDLWVTKDGYIVQMHDNDVSHSTDGTGLVTQMTLDEILALHTKHFHNAVPQLSDSLALPIAHEAGRYLMFETKFSFAKRANLKLLDQEITDAGMTNNVIIYTSFLNHAKKLKQIDPDLIVWFKSVDGVPDVSEVLGLNGVMIPSGALNAAVVDTFHAVGMTVTRERVGVETPTAWTRFVRTGADSLMTYDAPLVIEECRGLG